jgi:hypothetical protein
MRSSSATGAKCVPASQRRSPSANETDPKRLAIWTQWLDTTLLAPVPHRQVVLTIPKRLCEYCLYRRRLLGEIDGTPPPATRRWRGRRSRRMLDRSSTRPD